MTRVRPSRLRLERLSRGLRLLDVAQELGLSEGLLSRLERGDREPTPEQLQKLARLYGARSEELRAP